jgi:hypothetical protein
MVQDWDSGNRSFSLYVTIKCAGTKRFFLAAKEKDKPHSNYARREMKVTGERTIHFSFPVTPELMTIGIFNKDNKADNAFEVTLEEKPLKTYNIWTDDDTREFLKLAFKFSKVCGYESASPKGRPFTNRTGKFNIKFYPVIVDYMTNKTLSTPARIGHNTGNIEVAKNKFDKYTFAERIMILLHEFSHKYKNPKMGLAISNETGADINGLYIYLGYGFSKIDAINVFANVFLKAQTEGNIKRMRAIMDYIARFENGEFAQIA